MAVEGATGLHEIQGEGIWLSELQESTWLDEVQVGATICWDWVRLRLG